MKLQPFDGSTCAAADLTARLLAELAEASAKFADAQQEFSLAAVKARTERTAVPFDIRSKRTACRDQVTLLRRILAGIYSTGEAHVESA
ncbi:MAG TPA: hypothetical protein VF384_00085 [Planctomycetota bacterium]